MARGDIDILLIGETGRAEMHGVVSTLESEVSKANVTAFADIHHAISHIDRERLFPDLVVVCQSWPDEYSKSEVEDLIGRLPLSRFVCCFGVWCESDGRNRDTWPHAVRVSARTALARIRSELNVLSDDRAPLPLTASRDEVFESDFDAFAARSDELPLVSVVSPDQAVQECVESTLKSLGVNLVTVDQLSTSRMIFWDIDPWDGKSCKKLGDLCRRIPEAKLIVLSGLAHAEDESTIKAAGAAAIVPKLASPELLLQTMLRLV